MDFAIDGLHLFLILLLVLMFIDRLSLKRQLARIERIADSYKRRALEGNKARRGNRRKGWW